MRNVVRSRGFLGEAHIDGTPPAQRTRSRPHALGVVARRRCDEAHNPTMQGEKTISTQ